MRINKNSRTHFLLKEYISKSINKQDFEELKYLVFTNEDENLGKALECLWNDNSIDSNSEMRREDIDEVLMMIEKKLYKQRRFSFIRRVQRIAAFITIPLLLGVLGFVFQDWNQLRSLVDKDVVVTIERGQKGQIILPDSTIVHLNAESLLSYKQNFGYKERNVNLQGEAFFEVRKGLPNKFHVFTDYLKIEVLGTSFNVYSYEDDHIVEMALVSGSVLVETRENPVRKVRVKPNEKILFNKETKQLNVEPTNTRFETAWLRGELVFRSEPIKEVFKKIERRYGVDIHIFGEWEEDDLFTGSFDCDEIEQVMDILKTHYAIKYKIRGDKISVYTQDEG